MAERILYRGKRVFIATIKFYFWKKEVKIMPIKFVDDIIKEIINHGKISVKNNCVTGEEFEKWLRRGNKVNGNKRNRSI